ncbi:MAG: acetolactate synthase large subunit, partial [Candidatus Binatota bacterium]|nr:acetolactate synthase large subunit [Candidatus Binatota bacterium]
LSPPGRIATLIVPADSAWEQTSGPAPVVPPPLRAQVPGERIREIAGVLRTREPAAILAGDVALLDPGIRSAACAAAKAGARLLCGTFPARLSRGAGRPRVERIPYFPERAAEMLAGLRHVVLAGDRMTVPFFAYPTISSEILPAGCRVHTLAEPGEDVVGALDALADELGGGADPVVEAASRPETGDGPITPDGVARVVGALLPENAILSDEGATSSLGSLPATAGAPPHDWLPLTGGAIGQGLPVAAGAALACPDRKVVALQADGSAMYTLQALWTQAREKLDVTTILFSNRRYAILGMELRRMANAEPTGRTAGLIDLSHPDLDWVQLARGMGVEAEHVETLGGLRRAFAAAMRTPGPRLLEVPI